MTGSRFRYYLCTQNRDPVEIDIHRYEDPFIDVFILYYVRAFQILETISELENLTVYFVWNYQIVRELPSYGDNVVAVLLQDEFSATPHYVNRIRFAFQAYGLRPWISSSLRGKNVATALKFAKDMASYLSHRATFLRRNGLQRVQKRRLPVPIGYARQKDLPVKPFGTRRYLVSFVGSLEQEKFNRLSPKRWIGTPKSIARFRMAEAIRRLPPAIAEQIFCGTTGSFRESILDDGSKYSEIMADTKICLAPRGSSVETYRFFEAMRQGCIVICDRLPPTWFYDGCPAIQIDDWKDLEAHLAPLVADPERMAHLHRRSLDWWDQQCSEAALAQMMKACLEATPVPDTATRVQLPTWRRLEDPLVKQSR